tara:strand:+ start:5732 stop:5911 length:180 start_codon:yes stop_codon:yes gene_type:complete
MTAVLHREDRQIQSVAAAFLQRTAKVFPKLQTLSGESGRHSELFPHFIPFSAFHFPKSK